MSRSPLQRKRGLFQMSFFLLFLLAPPLDIFRLDLHLGHFILFGQDWTLGLGTGELSAAEMTLNVILRGFLPLALVAGTVLLVAWRWGRLYCGWLCPHFSMIEVINRLMQKASGKPSLWETAAVDPTQPDGSRLSTSSSYWLPTVLLIISFAFIWALTLLTYLLPPFEIYHNLLTASLTPNQWRFLLVATFLLSIEFTFARHFFCRYACAVGVFQSHAWMANSKAMVVNFDRQRAAACLDCNKACDNVCPMRLKPRNIKRKMFACTECAQCISACSQVQAPKNQPSLLKWTSGQDAEEISETLLGKRKKTPIKAPDCSPCPGSETTPKSSAGGMA